MQAVSASLTESLRTLCRSGGVLNANELTFRQPSLGRIHTTYLATNMDDKTVLREGNAAGIDSESLISLEFNVAGIDDRLIPKEIDAAGLDNTFLPHHINAAGRDNKFILQDINTQVICDPVALARVTDLALASAGHDGAVLSWPAQGGLLFRWNDGYWLRRRYIDGESLTLPLNTRTLHAMGRAMRTLHSQISPADFSACDFTGVNPWSAAAAQSLSARWLDNHILLNASELAVANELASLSARLSKMQAISPEKNRLTVVHRDTKPSNFLRKLDDTLLLIDFDTLGLGDPVCDLGEATRALVVGDNDGEALDGRFPERHEIIDAVQAMCEGYGSDHMQVKPVLIAALSCCLCQAQRFLDDHLAGDVYYSVKVHGESLEHTRRQLQAMHRLFECHAVL